MNILILSCGTRNKLIEFFRQKFEKVVVTDCSEYAPALYVANKYYIVPRMDEPVYLETLLDICEKENINAILPLQEDELVLMSMKKKLFENKNIKVILSPYNTIILCRDKLLFYEKMASLGVSVVPTYHVERAMECLKEYGTVMVKPRYGAGSVGNMIIKSPMLLQAYIESQDEELVIQPNILGKEYGIDSYVDMVDGHMVAAFVKEKIRMRAGETEKSISVDNDRIFKLVKAAISCIEITGPLDMDVMEYNGDYSILEINPRFGGGYPHAHECGVNLIDCIYNNIKGLPNNSMSKEYKVGVKCMKYSNVLVI